jgi:hypothetical protein
MMRAELGGIVCSGARRGKYKSEGDHKSRPYHGRAWQAGACMVGARIFTFTRSGGALCCVARPVAVENPVLLAGYRGCLW